jgi:hypothetical protein
MIDGWWDRLLGRLFSWSVGGSEVKFYYYEVVPLLSPSVELPGCPDVRVAVPDDSIGEEFLHILPPADGNRTHF